MWVDGEFVFMTQASANDSGGAKFNPISAFPEDEGERQF